MTPEEYSAIGSAVAGYFGQDLYEEIYKHIHQSEYSLFLRPSMRSIEFDGNPYSIIRGLAASLLQAEKILQKYQENTLLGLELAPRTMVMCHDCPNRENIERQLETKNE